jgi:hypothetical protein
MALRVFVHIALHLLLALLHRGPSFVSSAYVPDDHVAVRLAKLGLELAHPLIGGDALPIALRDRALLSEIGEVPDRPAAAGDDRGRGRQDDVERRRVRAFGELEPELREKAAHVRRTWAAPRRG